MDFSPAVKNRLNFGMAEEEILADSFLPHDAGEAGTSGRYVPWTLRLGIQFVKKSFSAILDTV